LRAKIILSFLALVGGFAAVASCSDSTGGACDSTLASIQENVFLPSCTGSGCHSGPTPAAGLNLTIADLEARLVDQPAATCDAVLVSPSHPDTSFLYEKITSSAPKCGSPMPLSGTLSDTAKQCIRDWIASLSPGCETCGGGSCVDLTTDASHCGACTTACPVGAICSASQCMCTSGMACSGACVDTLTDPANCGGCEKGCVGAEVCNKGSCSAMCDAGLTKCGSSCVDTTSDAANCGGCSMSCGTGGVCQSSSCLCAGGADPMTDPSNCGSCGNVCAPGDTCEAGVCHCSASGVSFSAEVQPIFTSNCATIGCHTGAMPKQGLNLSSGKAFANLVGQPATECSGGRQRVKPGDPSNSYVMDKMLGVDLCFGSKMPKLSSLPSAQIQTISDWICEGAPNN
jgi:Stigma-specific protein, Stig1